MPSATMQGSRPLTERRTSLGKTQPIGKSPAPTTARSPLTTRSPTSKAAGVGSLRTSPPGSLTSASKPAARPTSSPTASPGVPPVTSGPVTGQAALDSRRDFFMNEFECVEEALRGAQDTANALPYEHHTGDTMVCVRVRPVIPHDPSTAYRSVLTVGQKVLVHQPTMTVRGVPKLQQNSHSVHAAFGPTATNDEVYLRTCQPLVELAAGGGTATILAYGQTGSGKSYTINALFDGASQDLFDFCQNHTLSVSVVQIMGNNVTDLLNATPAAGQNNVVTIREDTFGNMVMLNLKEMPATSPAELHQHVKAAMACRRTEETLKNEVSSRSHMIIRITVKDNNRTSPSDGGTLFLVDLAGSENGKDSIQHNKERTAEMKQINTSLMTLKECMVGRTKVRQSTSHVHIPYRANKLTQILRDCFELSVRRPVKTVFLACVSPLHIDAGQSTNTLTYASAVATAPKQVVLAEDPEDPYGWTREKSLAWITKASKGRAKGERIIPVGDGRTLSEIPEGVFLERAMSGGGFETEKQAKDFYLMLWKRLVDARTRRVNNTKAVRNTKTASPDDEAAGSRPTTPKTPRAPVSAARSQTSLHQLG